MPSPFPRWMLLCSAVLIPTCLLAEPVRSFQAMRCDEAPVIDGKLDEEAWGRAPVIDGLTAVQPVPGEPLSERTELRILFDDKSLYLGLRCYDGNPAGISGRGRERDGTVLSGDYVSIFFDTFGDRRNGYAFAVSPDEGRWDALVSNHFTANTDWDGIWNVRCTTNAKGWIAEIAIPFKTLSYDYKLDTWGFNFSRNIARKGELGIWNAARPESRVYYAGNAGLLAGLKDLPRNLGFEVSPYVLGRYDNNERGSNSLTGDVGLDVRWRIGTGLNATLSLNTDFAETEVDQRKINFGRFPLFFPEKRKFFLEDSGIYRFADLNQGLVIPYYTRRIGLSSSGEPVPIIGAGKISGRAGVYELGATAAVIDENAGVDPKALFAGRLTRPLFGDSTAGIIATAGDPRSNGDNYVAGVDFRFQTIKWQDQQTLIANLFYLTSQTDPVDSKSFSGHAFGMGLSYPGDTISASFKAAEISGGFDPALGFIRRGDVRTASSFVSYLLRPEEPTWWQSYSVSLSNSIYTDLDNHLESFSNALYPLNLRFPSNDELSFGILDLMDQPDYDFYMPNDVLVPAGRYDMTNYDFSFTFSDKRPISGSIGTTWGDYYGGDYYSLYSSIWWLPVPLLACGVDYSYSNFNMPDGDISSHVVSLWLTLRFTPRMRWANLIQYDTISESVGLNSRFSWEYRDGRRFDLVFSQLYWDDSAGSQTELELIAKLGMQIRF